MLYKTQGTCSKEIEIELDDERRISKARFKGGCAGNTQGVASLVIGQKADDVIARLSGIRCGMRPTSCPDQLARAVQAALEQQQIS